MKHTFLIATLFWAGCCPNPSVAPSGTNMSGKAPWTATVVDLTQDATHAHLGAPISSNADGVGGPEECFAVVAPFTSRCVVYVGARVLLDNITSIVPAAQVISEFQRTVDETAAMRGGPDEQFHFIFTPGEHVLGMWAGRGFRFGESCVFESAREAAKESNPAGLAIGSPELIAAAAVGTACLRAVWRAGASIHTTETDGDDPADAAYHLNHHYHSLDAERTMLYQRALDAGVSDLMKKLENLDAEIEAYRAENDKDFVPDSLPAEKTED